MSVNYLENHVFDEIHIGQEAELQRTLTRDDIALFGKVSGDVNPIHHDAGVAQRLGQSGVTGHSLWSAGLVSNLLGNVLPGPGTSYRRQDTHYAHSVSVGDTVTARITVIEKHLHDHSVVFDCEVRNQRNEPVMHGIAEVTAPLEKMRVPIQDMPEISVSHHDSYLELFDSLKSLDPVAAACIHPCSDVALQGVVEAADGGYIEPVLVGPAERIRAIAERFGIDIDRFTIEDVPHSHAAAARAVEMVHEARVQLLMKGSLHTDELLSAVLARTSGIRTDRRISHVFAMDVPAYPKLLLVTDAAVNVAPGLSEKADICQNAIDLAHTLGIARPLVAVLSATETVNPRIQSTLDAAALCKMAERGQITGAILDGPLAMDNAVNLEAARTKGIVSSVAGQADILVAPDLEAGNILAKQLSYLAHADAAGIVLGARVPIVLTSRADGPRVRQASAALAVLHARERQRTSVAGAAA